MLILYRRIDPFLPSPASCLGGCFLCIGWCHLQVYASPVLIRFRNVHLLPPHYLRVTLTERLSNAFATPLKRPPTAPQISCNASQCQRKCPSYFVEPNSHLTLRILGATQFAPHSLQFTPNRTQKSYLYTLIHTRKTYLYTLLRSRNSLSRTHNYLHLTQSTLRNYSPQCALQLQWVCAWNEMERKCNSMYTKTWLRNGDVREL